MSWYRARCRNCSTASAPALALSFILLVSSELISAQRGFGYLIGYLGDTGSYEGMFAVVLTVAFLGFAADRLYQILMHWLLRWRE
jgi:NitT/TauT family transport system permease protein